MTAPCGAACGWLEGAELVARWDGHAAVESITSASGMDEQCAWFGPLHCLKLSIIVFCSSSPMCSDSLPAFCMRLSQARGSSPCSWSFP